MAIYILKMDNPKDPLDQGSPTRIRLIGPFSNEDDAGDWGRSEENNPHDNPCWQTVDLPDYLILRDSEGGYPELILQVEAP